MVSFNFMYTTSLDVWGSYPVPPEAKLTPVYKSLICREGSKYAGTSSLIPNSAAEDRITYRPCQFNNRYLFLTIKPLHTHTPMIYIDIDIGIDNSVHACILRAAVLVSS